MHIIGLDIGYRNIKRGYGHSGNGSPRYDTWMAVAMPASEVGISVTGESASDRRAVVDGHTWLLGMNPDQKGVREMLNDGYIGSDIWRAHFLYGIDVGRETKSSHLVLGMPASQWLNESARMNLESVARQNAEDAGIPVSGIDIIPQPMGAFIDANVRSQGALMNQNVLVVDPGGYTLDWTVFSRGRLSHEGSGSDRRGSVSRIIDGVARGLYTQHGLEVSRARVRNALDAGETEIGVGRKRVDCRSLIRDVTNRVLDESLVSIVDAVRGDDPIDTIVLAGGGAGYYKGRLTEAFEYADMDAAPRPAQANVRGYWWYGTRSARG